MQSILLARDFFPILNIRFLAEQLGLGNIVIIIVSKQFYKLVIIMVFKNIESINALTIKCFLKLLLRLIAHVSAITSDQNDLL